MSGVRPEDSLAELFQYTREFAYKLQRRVGEISPLWEAYELRKEASSKRGKHGLALRKNLKAH